MPAASRNDYARCHRPARAMTGQAGRVMPDARVRARMVSLRHCMAGMSSDGHQMLCCGTPVTSRPSSWGSFGCAANDRTPVEMAQASRPVREVLSTKRAVHNRS